MTQIEIQKNPVPPQAPEFSGTSDNSNWDYTKNAAETAELRKQIERNLGSRERHTIGRDLPIAEGVYEGTYGGEAIVVDYSKDPELIDNTIQSVLNYAKDPRTSKIRKDYVLEGVFNEVTAKMGYDSNKVDTIFNDVLGSQNGRKISLSYYIAEGAGECRHQALYAGVVLEQLINRGVLNGAVSVDRNMVKRGADGKYDGHAWTRYTNSAGDVFILDVAQGKLDSLTNLMATRANDPESTWDYARQEDYQKQTGATVLRVESPQAYDPSTYTNQEGVIDRLPWKND